MHVLNPKMDRLEFIKKTLNHIYHFGNEKLMELEWNGVKKPYEMSFFFFKKLFVNHFNI